MEAFDETIDRIREEYEAGDMMNLGAEGGLKAETISTGSMGLDQALQVGGVPKGRITEIYGKPGVGKTTLALHVLANAQENSDNPSVFIDAEHALDTEYAENIGLQKDKTYISQPNSGEKALNIVQMVCEGGGADIIVVDSVAALTPEAELKGEMGESQVGVQARLMSQAMRKLRGVVRKRDTALIFINQMRANINTNNPFGPQSTTTGGKALRYYATVRIKLWYGGNIEYRNEKIGNVVGAEVAKNKLGPPHHKTEFDLIYGKGIDKNRELVTIGMDKGIIKTAGAWYKYEPKEGDTVTLGQGKQDAANSLEEDDELKEQIEDHILEE